MSRTSPNLELRKAPFDCDREHVTELVYQGKSDEEIGQFYNVTRDTIWCRRNRWGLPSGCEVKENKLKSDMTTLWSNGYTVEEIAQVLGMCVQVVYTKMRHHKIRDITRMGISAPNMSLTELRQAVGDGDVTDEDTVVISYKRLPKWVMVPIEYYQDHLAGQLEELNKREQ